MPSGKYITHQAEIRDIDRGIIYLFLTINRYIHENYEYILF